MGPFGELVVSDLSAAYPWDGVVGKVVSEVGVIRSRTEGREIGIKIQLDSTPIFILNLGDELFLFRDSIHKDVMRSEGIQVEVMS